MPPTDEASFISQVIAWVAAGIASFFASVFAWLWSTTMGRITKLEEGKVNQKTFDDYIARFDKDRDERRETETSLFDEIKQQRIHFDTKLDKITELIMAKK
jgi:hypothetical protein